MIHIPFERNLSLHHIICTLKDYVNFQIQYGIDDNTATGVMVRGDTSSFKQITTDNILSDFEFRPLWFIYYNRTLRIGAGHIWGQNILMTYETKEPIDATGVILNNAMKTPAEWSILPETGMYTHVPFITFLYTLI